MTHTQALPEPKPILNVQPSAAFGVSPNKTSECMTHGVKNDQLRPGQRVECDCVIEPSFLWTHRHGVTPQIAGRFATHLCQMSATPVSTYSLLIKVELYAVKKRVLKSESKRFNFNAI
jgi:hypothetical protein